MNTARDFTHRLQDLLRRERLALGDCSERNRSRTAAVPSGAPPA